MKKELSFGNQQGLRLRPFILRSMVCTAIPLFLTHLVIPGLKVQRKIPSTLPQNVNLDERGFEPLTAGSMRKNITTESYPDTGSESLAESGFEPLTIESMHKNLTIKLS